MAAALEVDVPTTPALPVSSDVNVFAPASVCVPVLTIPLKDASAFGILRFKVEDERLNPTAALVVVMPRS